MVLFLADHRATDFPYAKTCGICDLDWVAPFQGFLAIGRQVCVAKCVCFVSSNIFLSLYIIIYAKLLISFYLLQQISDYSLIPPTLDAILTPSYNAQIGCRRSLVLLRLLHNLYFRLRIGLSLFIFWTFFLKKAAIIHTSCIFTTIHTGSIHESTSFVKAVTEQDFSGILFVYYTIVSRSQIPQVFV